MLLVEENYKLDGIENGKSPILESWTSYSDFLRIANWKYSCDELELAKEKTVYSL